MSKDNFQGAADALNAVSDQGIVITPNDDNDLDEVPKYLYIGATGGALSMIGRNGETVVFWTVPGQIVAFRPHRILETNTDATPIIACY